MSWGSAVAVHAQLGAPANRLQEQNILPPPDRKTDVRCHIAEFERGLIRKRCEEGIERAKRKGTKFGRPSALDDSEKRAMAERYAKGETMEQLAVEYEVGIGTIWRSLQPGTKAPASSVSPQELVP